MNRRFKGERSNILVEQVGGVVKREGSRKVGCLVEWIDGWTGSGWREESRMSGRTGRRTRSSMQPEARV